jgi:3-oxoadipate enol-lactonase
MTVEVQHVADGPADAPVVLLSNSLGSTLAMWDRQVPALAERYRVVRYDHRGHGRSPVPPGPYELEDVALDALALLDRLGVERAHVCGLSLGGMVGMWIASHAPERVDRLALLCTSAKLGPPSMWAERAAAARASGTDSLADAGVGRWLTDGFAARRPDVRAEMRAMIAGQPDAGYADCCGVIERMDQLDDLAAIRAPTLVIAGAQDPATPPAEHAEPIAARIPGARLEIVADASHMAPVEQPEVVTALLLEHLSPV